MSIYINEFEKMYGVSENLKGLRDRVITLAMQGKLLDNISSDNGLDLLNEIKIRRSHLEKSKIISVQKKLKTLKNEEIPFDLPDNWTWSKFGEIVDYSIGKTPRRNETSYWNNGDFKWVSIADMSSNNRITDTKETVSEKAFNEIFNGKISLKETLIMSFKLTVGKVSILDFDAFHNEAIISIYPIISDDNILRDYLFWLLPYLTKMGKTKSAIKGNTLNSDSITNLLIPLPPLDIQKKIVKRIETLTFQINKLEEQLKKKEHLLKQLPIALVDSIGACKTGEELKEQLEFVIQNFETIFQTPESMQELRNVILQLAIEGKLVPQDPTDEPASELLKRIEAEREQLVKEKKIRKPSKLEPISEDEIPFEVPESWEWVRLNNIVDVRDGTHETPKYIDEGYPLVTSKNISSGYIDLANVKYISKEDYNKINERSKVDVDDILFAMIGTIGNPVLVTEEPNYAIKNVALFKTYTNGAIMPTYLLNYLLIVQNHMKSISSGAVQRFVSLTFLREYLIALPPVNEQYRIVNRINSLMLIIDQMEEKLKKKVEIVEKLGTA